MRAGNEATVAGLLAQAAARLDGDGRAQAELLLCHVLDRSRAWLIAHADDVPEREAVLRLDGLVSRRARGEPVAQILGHCGFWTLDLRVTPDVLIPRADTELLVERALMVLPSAAPLRVADLGTGSGAICLAIASEREYAHIDAVDASATALHVAQTNARTLGLDARVRCLEGDWFAPLRGETYDAIVSNPPYVAETDPHLSQGDLRFEPRSALVSGVDGLDAIRAIVREAPAHLRAGGWLLLEHGCDQGAAVRELMVRRGFADVGTWRDIERRERVSGGRWPGTAG